MGCPGSPCRMPTASSRSASPTPSLDGGSVDRRRGCWRPSPALELIPGRASFYVRLLTPVAKLVKRARGNGRVIRATLGRGAADERALRDRTDAVTDPRATTDAAVTIDGPARSAAPRRRPPRRSTPRASKTSGGVATSVAPAMSSLRRHGRPALARAPAAPAADDRLARPAARPARPLRRTRCLASGSIELPGLILRANPLLLLAAFLVFYPGSRCAACAGRS